MPRPIQVFEHETLRYVQPGAEGMSKSQWQALVRFNERNGNKYFTVVSRGIKFRQYVGVLRVGSLTIEILPKADRSGRENGTKAYWRKLLLDMLRKCRLLKIDSLSDASLRLSHSTLLDIYLDLFLTELELLVHGGLIRKYVKRQANLPLMKGRLLFSQHIARNAAHRERFFTEHTVFSLDHQLHRVLYAALAMLPRLSSSLQFGERIGSLLLAFPELPLQQFTAEQLNTLRFDRKTEPYRTAVGLARMILTQNSPELSHGPEQVLAILFDMNRLFEEYIFRILQKAVVPPWQVSRQVSRPFWDDRHVRPDILLSNGVNNFILDTKWKELESAKPDLDDLRQMYVYNTHFHSRKSILLYPDCGKPFSLLGNFALPHVFENPDPEPHFCKVMTIGLYDPVSQRLDVDAGQRLYDAIVNEAVFPSPK